MQTLILIVLLVTLLGTLMILINRSATKVALYNQKINQSDNIKLDTAFVCISPRFKNVDHKGNDLNSHTEQRALFYSAEIGKYRIYRDDFANPDKRFTLITFKYQHEAQQQCDDINKAYNDTFEVRQYDIENNKVLDILL